jgi:hypothetical protein
MFYCRCVAVQTIQEKIGKMYQKVAKTAAKPKQAKISRLSLNLKVQSIYIKQLLKSTNPTTNYVLKLLV